MAISFYTISPSVQLSSYHFSFSNTHPHHHNHFALGTNRRIDNHYIYHYKMEQFPSSRVGKIVSVGCSNKPYNHSNTGPHLHICSKRSSRVLIHYSQWDHLHKKELFLSIYTQTVKSIK